VAGAVTLLEDAERVYDGDFSPNVQPVPAMRARLLVAQGRLAEAVEWASVNQLAPDDDLSYVREYEHVTLARILLHRHVAHPTQSFLRTTYGLLERLRVAAEDGGRVGTLIEILSLEALAHHDPALLERALRLAESEGYVRVFVGEGAAMATLLETLSRQQASWSYPRRLLETLGVGSTVPRPQRLVDPLSARELDVLRLLASDLDGPAIARELVVSLNTVRTHTKNIYAKLGVNSRRAAVTRARELDLFSRTGPA
jgi:LuxR family maltose regulon positive regulatory protein